MQRSFRNSGLLISTNDNDSYSKLGVCYVKRTPANISQMQIMQTSFLITHTITTIEPLCFKYTLRVGAHIAVLPSIAMQEVTSIVFSSH